MSTQNQPVVDYDKLQAERLDLTDGLGQHLRRAQAMGFALNRAFQVDEGTDPELQAILADYAADRAACGSIRNIVGDLCDSLAKATDCNNGLDLNQVKAHAPQIYAIGKKLEAEKARSEPVSKEQSQLAGEQEPRVDWGDVTLTDFYAGGASAFVERRGHFDHISLHMAARKFAPDWAKEAELSAHAPSFLGKNRCEKCFIEGLSIGRYKLTQDGEGFVNASAPALQVKEYLLFKLSESDGEAIETDEVRDAAIYNLSISPEQMAMAVGWGLQRFGNCAFFDLHSINETIADMPIADRLEKPLDEADLEVLRGRGLLCLAGPNESAYELTEAGTKFSADLLNQMPDLAAVIKEELTSG